MHKRKFFSIVDYISFNILSAVVTVASSQLSESSNSTL